MATGVQFCLLGPLTVRHDGVVVPVAPGKQRALLAALLLSANRVVAVDDLVDVLWGAAPPANARVAAQNYVLRLRRTLAGVGDSRITTVAPGYVIRVADGELDVCRFEALRREARLAAREGSWDHVAARLRLALSLWRGEPLADVPSELLAARELPALREMRLQALETCLDADLRLGRHADVIGELRQLTATHPLRERLHGLLMLALYRDGQQASALVAYQEARAILVGELGAEPGPELRQLQLRILDANPVLAAPPVVSQHPRRRDRVVPRQLPGSATHFTGRAAELATLTWLLDERSASAGTVLIAAIAGTAGVGKTALAVHWAHQVADRFPDGQLYVDLRGYAPGDPVPAADALEGFLHALGVPGQDLPVQTAGRAALYRSLLAGRRMLIVLDNAADADQVRPLLPGTRDCAVVVTSRHALPGLLARDGASRVDLDLLTLGEAVSMLKELIGQRVDNDPEATAALAAQCARLPLALRIAAEFAAARSAVPLAELAGELADHQQRLDLLDSGGDPATAVRAVFSWSYRHLGREAADAFRALGLHPGLHIDAGAAAALTARTAGQVRRALDELASAHLIHPGHSGRYGMHDLLRAYARDLTAELDSADAQAAALTRLFDHYLHTASVAMNTLYPADRKSRPGLPALIPAIAPPDTPAAARAWLDAERANLVAVASRAASGGWPGHATRLAATTFRYLDEAGHYGDSYALNAHALDAGRLSGDPAAQAGSLWNLGTGAWRQGRYRQASDYFKQALELYRDADDEIGQARTLGRLGVTSYSEGRYSEAVGYHRRALALYRAGGDQLGEARTVDNLGLTLGRMGRYRQAGIHHQRALALFRALGDRTAVSGALDNLGVLSRRQGQYQRAVAYHRQSLANFRDLGHAIGEGLALDNLGRALGNLGNNSAAAGYHRKALAKFREVGSADGEAGALDNLGRALGRLGRPREAAERHTQAVALYRELGNRPGEAEALNSLAESMHAVGDLAQARDCWQRALAIYSELRVPEADRVRMALDNLG